MLAKRLDEFRERRADELLRRARDAEAIMSQLENDEPDPERLFENASWNQAFLTKVRLREELAILDSMTLVEILEQLKSEQMEAVNAGRRNTGTGYTAGG